MQSEARALARSILSGDAPPYTHVVPPHPPPVVPAKAGTSQP